MSARHAISNSTEPEKAAPTEPRAKMESPTRNIRLRPNLSARLPPRSNSPANTTMYVSTIHCNWLDVALRSRTSVGSATLRMVLSMLMISVEAHNTASAIQRRLSSAPSAGMESEETFELNVGTASVSPTM